MNSRWVFSVAQIVRTLTERGTKLEDYFICGGLPCTWRGGLEALTIEDNELLLACIQYLRDIGALEYQTHEEFERAKGEGLLPSNKPA